MTDLFTLSTLDARSLDSCTDCVMNVLKVEFMSVILDDKTSFAAAADRAMVDTVSSDELRLPTISDVCLVRRSNDWTVSVTDELKLMTVDDNNVTLAKADRALDEVVSSVALMLSIRDSR